MRSLPTLEVNDKQIYDEIAAAKRQPQQNRLVAARAMVVAAYAGYEKAAPELGVLPDPQLTLLQREALLHAYAVETAPLLKLRESLLKRVDAVRCPFCGLSESSTLDHYLPKEMTPQFALFSRNLVPCCPLCNSRKLDKVLGNTTQARLFLHPYYDEVPKSSFLKVKVLLRPDALALRYGLVRPEEMPVAAFRHLETHFQLLDLADRYRLMALEHLRGQYRPLARAYGTTKDAARVASNLKEKAEDFEDQHGPNYWLVVLYRALATNEEFCGGGFAALQRIQ